MALKTREKLIEVARQLFLRKGVENTTISDIANASDKGRRTIYTYFKNKKEIYSAVVEGESDKMVSELHGICVSDMAPADKLGAFITAKLSQTRSASSSYSLKSLMKLDFRKSGQIHKKVLEKEERLLLEILEEGVECGAFDPEKCSLMRNFALQMIQGLDLLSFHEANPSINPGVTMAFVEFITSSVTVR